jgi:hypothetical protein
VQVSALDGADSHRARTVSRPILSQNPTELTGDHLQTIASRAGAAWADERTRELRSQTRAIAGAWPGTLTEAIRLVTLALASADHAPISSEQLRELARTANRTARDAWRAVAVADEEL